MLPESSGAEKAQKKSQKKILTNAEACGNLSELSAGATETKREPWKLNSKPSLKILKNFRLVEDPGNGENHEKQ